MSDPAPPTADVTSPATELTSDPRSWAVTLTARAAKRRGLVKCILVYGTLCFADPAGIADSKTKGVYGGLNRGCKLNGGCLCKSIQEEEQESPPREVRNTPVICLLGLKIACCFQSSGQDDQPRWTRPNRRHGLRRACIQGTPYSVPLCATQTDPCASLLGAQWSYSYEFVKLRGFVLVMHRWPRSWLVSDMPLSPTLACATWG